MIIRVNPDKCTGCSACEAYCSVEQEKMVNPARSRIGIVRDEEHNVFLPILCPPCAAHACVAACPEPGAIGVDAETGRIVIVEALCTGCSKCIRACEIGAIRLLRASGRGKLGKAVVFKCNQCGGDPWCVRVCQPGALEYVDADGQTVYAQLQAALAKAEPVLAERGRPPRVKAK